MTLLPKPSPRGPKPRRRIARSVRPRKVKKTSRGKMAREADRLFSLIIRHPGNCMARVHRMDHACAGHLQCCHIVSRSYHSTRWDEDNAVSMCQAGHVWYTHNPIQWRQFVCDFYGANLLACLENRALEVWDGDIVSVLARLKARAEELGIK